jgi:hypothetical protein
MRHVMALRDATEHQNALLEILTGRRNILGMFMPESTQQKHHERLLE